MPARSFAPVPDRLKWWTDARFGISFHWGLYSIPARGEWVRSNERISLEDYRQYFDHFNPDRYDPRLWARLARAAGMKYAILTTKHHDGFCLFDSKLTQYKSTNTPARRDLIKEYVDAFRAEGIKVGLYYSLVDWQHPDCPAFGDRQHPMRHNPAMKERDAKCNWSNYVNYFHGQVRELLSNYGKIDLFFYDFSYWQYTGAKWGAAELVQMMRSLQPDLVINDRLGNGEGGIIRDENPPVWAGDFDTCELNTPHDPVVNARGQILPWEIWITHNNSWGIGVNDHACKTAPDVIRTLVNCVSKSGNLTMNFSPDARGQLPPQSVQILKEIAAWMELNSPSIHGCGMAPFARPDWGRYTMSNDRQTLYAHILEQPMGHLTLRGLRGKVRRARQLANGAEAFITPYWNYPIQKFGEVDDVFLNLNKPVMATWPLPDKIDTVIAMDLVPEAERSAVFQQQSPKEEIHVPFP